MARGKTYELKAIFTAQNKAGRAVSSLEKQLQKLKKTVDSFDNTRAEAEIGEHGADRTEETVKRLIRLLEEYGGIDEEASLGVSKTSVTKTEKTLAKVKKEFEAWSSEDFEATLSADPTEALNEAKRAEARLKRLAGQAYEASIKARAQGFDGVERDARELAAEIHKLSSTTANIRARMEGKEKLDQQVSSLQRELTGLSARPWQVELDGDVTQMKRAITDSEARLKAFAARVYSATLKVNQEDFPEAHAALTALGLHAEEVSKNRAELKAEIDGVPKVLAGLITVKRAAEGVEGTYTVRVNTSSLATLGGLLRTTTAGMGGLSQAFRTATPLSEAFARQVYVGQQAMQVFVVALIAVGVAAAGPLVSGLTIAAMSIGTVVGGLGLMAAAFYPVISALQKDKENQQQAAQARMQFESATSSVTSAQQSYKSALSSVTDAQQTHEQAERDYNTALHESRQATQEYNMTLADEKYRIQDLKYEVQGLGLDQKELALDIKDARKELEKAQKSGSSEDVKRAQIALQRLLLRQKELQNDVRTSQEALNRARKHGTDELISAKDAMRSAHDQQISAADAMKKSERGVMDAQQAAATAQKKLAQAQQKRLLAQDQLNKKTKALPGYIQALKDELHTFKGAWLNAFEPGNKVMIGLIIKAMRMRDQIFPTLSKTAYHTTVRMGDAFSKLYHEFSKFGVLKSLQKILKSMPGITNLWIKAIGRFAGGFFNVMKVAIPYSRHFARYIADAAKAFLRWSDSDKGRKQIKHFFDAAAPVAKALWHQIVRIGGAILKWSVAHPQKVAAMIRFMGNMIVRAGKFVAGVITAIMHFRRTHPILAKIAWFFLKWGAILYALRGPILFAAKAFRALGGAAVLVGRIGIAAFVGIDAAMAATALSAGAVAVAIAGIAVIIIKVFQVAYRVTSHHTHNWVNGMVKMHKQGALTMGDVWRVAFRGILSDSVRIFGKLAHALAYAFLKPLDATFGRYTNIFDKALGRIKKTTDHVADAVQGDTGRMAESIGKNMNKGADKGSAAADRLQKNTNNSMSDIEQQVMRHTVNSKNKASKNWNDMYDKLSKNNKNMSDNTDKQFNKIFKDISNSTGKSKKTTISDFTDLRKGGVNQSDIFHDKSSSLMTKLQKDINDSTTTTKKKGINDFTDFKVGGVKQSDILRSQSGDKMHKMQGKVTSETHDAYKHGLKSLTDLQYDGNAKMSLAQEQWSDNAWQASYNIQYSLRAVLSGMRKFIENANIDMPKPHVSDLVLRKSADVGKGNPGAAGGGGGHRAFAQGGIYDQGPTGGKANGTTRVYGEVPGTTEWYITNNRKYQDRNIDYLGDAAHEFGYALMKLGSGGIVQDSPRRNKEGSERRELPIMYEGERTRDYVPPTGGNPLGGAAVVKLGSGAILYLAHGGKWPPKAAGLRNTGGDNVVNYNANGNVSGQAHAGAALWNGLVKSGGHDVHVVQAHGHIGGGHTNSRGKVTVGPHTDKFVMGHEFGHTLGLGHGGNGIMGGRGRQIGGPSHGDFEAIQHYYGGNVPSGGGGGGSSAGHKDSGGFSEARLKDVWTRARKYNGSPYVWGGSRAGGTDCSGWAGFIHKWALGSNSTTGRLGSTANMPWPGWKKGPGEVSFGFVNGGPGGGHVAATLVGDTWTANTETGGPHHNTWTNTLSNSGPAWGAGNNYFHGNIWHLGADANMAALAGGGGIDYEALAEKYVPHPHVSGPWADQLGYQKIIDKYRDAAIQEAISHAPVSSTSGGGGGIGTAPPGEHGGSPAQNRALGKQMAESVGWGGGEWNSLDKLWTRESGWNRTARNASSGAYGIPQALPASKMGADANPPKSWADAQIRWGLGYIKGRYGDPNAAWGHSQQVGWYGAGGKHAVAYSKGGIARTPQLGIVGDRGGHDGELMWPLGDQRATRAIARAFDKSRTARTVGGDGSHNNTDIIQTSGRHHGGDVAERIDDLKDTIVAELRENMKEIALDEKTMQNLIEFGVKTALATIKSQAGGDEIKEHVGKSLNFGADMKGLVK